MLTDRIRPNVECAPWVFDEIRRLELELFDAYMELRKIRNATKAIYDREVWDKAESFKQFKRE
jgi:hypothetical protein